MNSVGCLTTQQLQAFLSGAATDSSRAAASHIESCASCGARAREIGGNLSSQLSSLREPTVALDPSQEASPPPTISTDPYLTRIDQRVAAAAYSVLAPAQGPGEFGRLGHYRVVGLLGKGGMAIIFRAEDTLLHRPVALKVMKPELAADREGCLRFLREAQVMAAIQHDHVVTVHQVGQEGQTVFLAMELLSGEPLDRWMRENPRRLMVDVVRIGKEIASGLKIIHEHGVVHRDIKPSNIWMKRKDTDPPSRFKVKILDFGVAALLKADTDLTASGIALGTPAYMSPEQARGKKVDPRSDLFSLGSVLYELTAGKKPFADDHTMAALTSLAIDTPPSVIEINPLAPPALSDLIDDLLQKDAADRPQTANEVFKQLSALEAELAEGDDTLVMRRASNRTTPRRRGARSVDSWWTASRLVVVTFVAAAVTGLGLFAFSQKTPPNGKHEALAADEASAKYLKDITPFDKELYPFVHGDDGKGKKKKFKGEAKLDKDGLPFVNVGGRFWQYGIFMHPPAPPHHGMPTSLSFKLDKKFRTFRSDVSVNNDNAAHEPLTFSVYGDGKSLWQSKDVFSDEERQSCEVKIAGVDILKIEVMLLGDIGGAHAVWLDPRVIP